MIEIMKRTSLVYSDINKNSNKYYILELLKKDDDYTLIKRYGRLGKRPTIIENSYSLSKATQEFNKTLDSKVKKGYKYCNIEDIMYSDGNFFN